MQITQRYTYSTYTVRAKVLKLFGGSFDLFDPEGNLVLHASQQAFKLKEDIRLYTDKSKTEELLTIKARQIIDFSSAYDIEDTTTGEKLGALKRKGWKSIVRDRWILMDTGDNEVGYIQEDNAWLGVVRRLMAAFVVNLIPQSYQCVIRDTVVCTFKQNFNPFVKKVTVNFPEASSLREASIDKRLGLATAILLCAIEGKQN